MTSQKILVALDRSEQAPFVFEQALAQCKDQNSHLMMVHILHTKVHVSTAPLMGLGTLADVDLYRTQKQQQQERVQEERQQAQLWLTEYYQKAIASHTPTGMECRTGEPGVEICSLAKEWNADLIVMGRRGHQGILEAALGSISSYVVHHAPCSVLVVQGKLPEIAKASGEVLEIQAT
ncbi:MAG: universal stress protein [Leptolyngbyaceae cyanobacterium CRU_2_3]|nr:universal stress protein [Leptolyngbyaceae cyanobacterium CRU_2_3]